MYSVIVESSEPTFIINFPKELQGKKLAIVAYEVEQEKPNSNKKELPYEERLSIIDKAFDGVSVNLDNFKFDRDKANNDDEEA